MANERKTEKIVRSHLEKFSEMIHIEEQSSEIQKIDKLLKGASKKGTGQGRPEFIVTFNKNKDFLIVIECKADILKHESQTLDKFAEYAVDGVLLYASFLSKEYDVLAIAVSGETTKELKTSHFLHLKGERKAVLIFDDKFLPIQDYLNGYLKSPEKFRQDYNTLLTFTKTLNDKLHTYKILESQRSLLLSCILIALEDDAFRVAHDKKTNPKDLADFLVNTVSEKLANANISREKLDNLNVQFGFIKTDTSLTTKEGLLKELIDEIDTNINQFIKTHEYFDVLGQLYIEFLKYANSDKGLGIVLTPPHITELFAELAQVNKNSIVYDNCTGTGGFLISAMKYMIKDAKGDEAKIKEIKNQKIIGTEYQSHIFALAVSNMYIHQDGKTNIINGDCFDKEVIEQAKAKNPTVGFLNPPYQGNKKTDIDELEFILNNLECLVDGGTCIAIVPMQKALATSGKIAELKQKLLDKHTLEAVFSMPDELFFNSDVNVVTCIMIFTAHRKHSPTKKTYFGYYKEDGFIKRKIQGRFDGFGKWESIKKKWVSYFLDENRKEEAGFSINKTVTAYDEWCAEAYMETDYSTLTERDFEDTVLNYVTFLLNNRNRKLLPHLALHTDIIERYINQRPLLDEIIDVRNCQKVRVSDLFNISYGNSLELIKLEQCLPMEEGAIPFVSRTEKNNGISAFVYEQLDIEPNPAHTLSVAVSGSVLSAFYQPLPYYTGFHVLILHPKTKMSTTKMLYYSKLISANKYKYNFGRQANRTLKDILIPKLEIE